MAYIYSPPKEIKVPKLDVTISWDEMQKREKKFLEELKEHCKKHGRGKNKGEIIYRPIADGNAMYMIFCSRPCILIHIPIGDAWRDVYFEKTANSKIISEEITLQRTLEHIFS